MTERVQTLMSVGSARALRCNARDTAPQRQARFNNTPWGRLRAERGWSLRHLAELADVNIADLSRIERGISSPSPDQARRILAAYDGDQDVTPL